VTHDQVEAMTMGDRVAILRDGRLEQVDLPQTLYDRPATLFVASFIGSPAMNLLRGRIESSAGRYVVALGSARLPLPDALLQERPALGGRVGEEVVVGIRPEALLPCQPERDGALGGEVVLVESLGSDLLAHVEVDADAVLVGEQLEAARELGAGGGNGGLAKRARLTARLAPSVPVSAGSPLRLQVDSSGLHFFDPHSERAL
jgi:multiple sugar transport system ATP-binding protein